MLKTTRLLVIIAGMLLYGCNSSSDYIGTWQHGASIIRLNADGTGMLSANLGMGGADKLQWRKHKDGVQIIDLAAPGQPPGYATLSRDKKQLLLGGPGQPNAKALAFQKR